MGNNQTSTEEVSAVDQSVKVPLNLEKVNSTTSSPDLGERSQKKRFLKSFTIEKRDILAFRHG